MSKFCITVADNWCGLYVDNKLYYQGHSIPFWVYKEVFGCDTVNVDQEWAEDRGELPNDISEVKLKGGK